MKEKEKSKDLSLKHVKELKNFPFKTFTEFKKAVTEGAASVNVDRNSIVLEWAQRGSQSSSWLNIQMFLLALLPFAAAIWFVIYIVVIKNWILFFALPVLVVFFFISSPASIPLLKAIRLSAVRKGLIALALIGFIWGLVGGLGWVVALNLTLMLLWYAQHATYWKAIKGLKRAVLKHEDLLCLFWLGDILHISLSNGDKYWSDYKIENGQIVQYDTED